VLFCGKKLSDVSDYDIALEAVRRLGLLNDHAAITIAAMLEATVSEHPRAVCTRYRKLGQQVSNGFKKELGIRANGFMSIAAYDELSEAGKKRAIDAHEITLLRATFHRSKVRMFEQAVAAGFDKVRFSPSHLDECDFCRQNSNQILYISEISELPITTCSREACSAFISPYRDYLREPN
jgi:hypothetical protein